MSVVHLLCVWVVFSWVWLAERPSFGKYAYSINLEFSAMSICSLGGIPFGFRGRGFGSDCAGFWS